jgi:uncharacterized protein YdhG (YjbR/CyaY superfamily)
MADNDTQGVDNYIAAQSADVQPALKQLREIIKQAAPEAQEVLSYQVPTYKDNGPLVSFAAAKNHCSFYVMSARTVEAFKDELKDFDASGGAVRFSPDKPLSAPLVKKIIKARIAENKAGKK